jgi:hypothetical protein
VALLLAPHDRFPVYGLPWTVGSAVGEGVQADLVVLLLPAVVVGGGCLATIRIAGQRQLDSPVL